MKKLLIFLMIGIFPIPFFAQNKYILDTLELFSNKIYSIYDLDVISYYDLNYTYHTELLQHTYKKTDEYLLKLEDIKKLKDKMFKTYYYIENLDYFEHTNYDMKKGGFEVDLGYFSGLGNIVYDDIYAKLFVAVNNDIVAIYLPSLPVKKVIVCKIPCSYKKSLFIPMPEESGVKIEQNHYKHKVLFVFKISDKIKVKYNKDEKSLLKADEVKFIVLDDDNNLLFEKLYTKNELNKNQKVKK